MTKQIATQAPAAEQAVGAGSGDAGGRIGIVDPTGSRPLTVFDNWPERIPVTMAELEAIEIWLKPLLDQIFGDGNA